MPRSPKGPSSDVPEAGASARSESTSARFRRDDVRIGHINGVFGLRGEVRLYLYNPSTELVGQRLELVLVAPDGARQTVTLEIRPGSGRRILGRIQGVGSPEAAAALKDHELVLHEADLPEPELNEWYHRDLVGTPVLTDTGEALGRLKEIVSGPAVDTWVVRGPRGTVWVHAQMDDLVDVQPPERIVVRAEAVLFV